ncbi:hypothetical protein [Erwinia sp. 198]|uniref:hypothetical protein n=1 Tax=Erwinia sp. 198 TaxID=2022746 RepID=UPI00131510BD|nr:hypothetical protein [Erwinia sp. 198]
MEIRVTRLETDVWHMLGDIQEIKSGLHEFKKEARINFRRLFGAIVPTTLGLALLIAWR